MFVAIIDYLLCSLCRLRGDGGVFDKTSIIMSNDNVVQGRNRGDTIGDAIEDTAGNTAGNTRANRDVPDAIHGGA